MKHSNYTYWVKPIADRPNICSGYAKIDPSRPHSAMLENIYSDRGYTELKEAQAREWQYTPVSGEMRSVVQDD